MKGVVLFVFLAFAVFSVCAQKSFLILVEDLGIKDSHSILLDTLIAKGYKTKIQDVSEPVELYEFGKIAHEAVIYLAPEADDLGDGLSSDALLDYVERGGSLLVAASPDVSDLVNTIAAEAGIEIFVDYVVDHFNYVDDSSEEVVHSTLKANDLADVEVIFPKKINKPILYRGTGLSVITDNPRIPLLTASQTAYISGGSAEEISDQAMFGNNILLAAAANGRNSNSRVVFLGSVDMLSDEFFDEEYGNAEFANNLFEWLIMDTGVLRVKSYSHALADTGLPLDMYTIKDKVVFSLDAEELKDGEWVPYAADDIQLEFKMLFPLYRLTLPHFGNGHYSVEFQLPDVYGIFKFEVLYARPGYTTLEIDEQIRVRPLRHDQYERFIPTAYPYYAASISCLAGFVLFTFVFLYHSGGFARVFSEVKPLRKEE